MDESGGYGRRATRLIPGSWVSVGVGIAIAVLVAVMAVQAVASQRPVSQASWDVGVPTEAQAQPNRVAAAAKSTSPTTASSSDRVLRPIQGVDPTWLARTAAATGIPSRALLAYASANLQLRAEKPACALGWNTIAAIGLAESGHGTHGGSAIDENGVARPSILGMRLDGSQGLAAIRDTDKGA